MLYSDWEHRETQVTSDLIRKGIEEHKINAELRAEIERLKQRTWVGLTDVLDFIEEFTGAERERHPMFSDGYDLALSHVKELVEAKLKEKNT